MATDLERAYTALKNKQAGYSLLWQYYDGNQPLVYSTERLKEVFRSINARFNQNWCVVVVDSVLDRLVLKGFQIKSSQAKNEIDRIWEETQLFLDAEDIHTAALVCGEAFFIAWKGEEGIEVYYNDPRLCHVFYKPDHPKEKEFAAKWWVDSEERYHMTLYYTDRLEHYTSRRSKMPSSAAAFEADDPSSERNPYGVIPVFHVRTSRRGVKSALNDVLTIQDSVNKLLADMMVAAEFGAYKQRWVISQSDTGQLPSQPGTVWSIPGGDGISQATSVGEFSETNLDMYLNSIDKLVNSVAVITRTPKHYFMQVGGNISGDALIAMEAPLIKRVRQVQAAFSVAWVELVEFLLKLSNISIQRSEIVPVWERTASVQPFVEAQTVKTSVDAGIPLKTQLRRDGWSVSELDQLEKDQSEESTKKTSMAQALLEEMRKKQEQSNGPDLNQQKQGSKPDSNQKEAA